ncbi:MAG: GatB/YqeY domain-containing protein [Fibrobacterota bacterium]
MSSSILQALMLDIKQAMKERQQEKLLALRTLHSEIKNLQINERRELSDADIGAVIGKAIKQRNDSIEQFKNAGRDDLAQKEQFQIGLYRQYLPKQLEKEEIEKLVEEVILKTGASGKKDMGAVMKELMPLVKGRADGKVVSSIVNQKLS